MESVKLNKRQTEIVNKYEDLSEDGKQLIEYILKIGSSGIFSQEEFTDFMMLLEKRL